jgi:small multidrug resistance pump
MQYWSYLAVAIALEAAGTTSMKLSDGFTKLVPSLLICLFYVSSFVALTFALKGIDVCLAYAIWSGIGTVIIAIIGILCFEETATALKIISIGLIVVGVVGLKLSGVNN